MTQPYHLLAKSYDEIFAEFRVPVDRARREILGKGILKQARTVCDLGCGTGKTALSLAARGKVVYAVDLSPAMCLRTRAKAKAAGAAIYVTEADMRTFRIPEPVDLLLCEGDALNHLPKRSDLKMVVRSVASALRPGGHFYFDVNNWAGFERYWPLSQWVEKRGRFVAMMRGGCMPGRNRAWVEIDWFVPSGALWRRYQERIEEICWSQDEIQHALAEAGFDEVHHWDAAPYFSKQSVVEPGCRSIYLARKRPVGL